jgi:8-oxo-dGTP diphosphatase
MRHGSVWLAQIYLVCIVHEVVDRSFSYKHARPAVAVDAVVFGLEESELRVLLIKRALPPFEDQWALPGGFVRMGEDLEAAVRRELDEEAGVRPSLLEQVKAYGQPQRDPREHTISIGFVALVNQSDHGLQAATDARDAQWFSLQRHPALAFDHDQIIQDALAYLRQRAAHFPVGLELLPPRFTLTAMQKMLEAIFDVALDRRNFRKKVLATGCVVPVDEYETGVAHRAAQLHRFDERRYERLRKQGFELPTARWG